MKKAAPKPHLIKKVAGIDPKSRADYGKAHVIISEKRDKKAAKYLVKDLPFPYTSRAQFERSMDTPLGTEWNSRVGFQRGTLPKVVTKVCRSRRFSSCEMLLISMLSPSLVLLSHRWKSRCRSTCFISCLTSFHASVPSHCYTTALRQHFCSFTQHVALMRCPIPLTTAFCTPKPDTEQTDANNEALITC